MPFFLFVGGTYLLLRDSMSGRSIGKFCCGLVVVNLMTGRPCGRGASISRNALFLLPGANVVAAFLEMATIVRDRQGQRLGDRFALTQVVEGFGAKDLAKAAQQWWLDFLARVEGHAQGRRGLKTPPYSGRGAASLGRCVAWSRDRGASRRLAITGGPGVQEKKLWFPPDLLALLLKAHRPPNHPCAAENTPLPRICGAAGVAMSAASSTISRSGH